MRISDCSSDVCSSDLADPPQMVNMLARDVLGTGGRGDTEEAYPMTKSHITSGFAAAMMAVAAAALPSAPALADIQFFTGPGSVQPDENVLLNKDTTGMTVFGDMKDRKSKRLNSIH